MTTKTFYFKDAVPTGAAKHRSLQDGGTVTAATSSTGWVAGLNGAGTSKAFCLQQGGVKVANADASWTNTSQPASAPTDTKGDCWRSEDTLTGTFSDGSWVFTFGARSVTQAYNGRFKMRVRVWKSANADGSSATEFTASTQQTAATSSALSTSADSSVTVTWAPGSSFTLTNEYLFVQVALDITSVGNGSTQDVVLRVDSSSGYGLTTPTFTAPYVYVPTGGIALAGVAPHALGKVYTPSAGLSLSGTAPHVLGKAYAPGGGIALGGAASLVKGKAPSPSGGIVLSGGATLAKTRVVVPSGGLALDGIAVLAKSKSYAPSGGVVFDGIAPINRDRVYVPGGGLIFAGAAAHNFFNGSTLFVYQPGGGLALSGLAPVVNGKVFAASGGIAFAGLAPVAKSKTAVVGGGFVLSGTATTEYDEVQANAFVYQPSGGASFSGTAALVITKAYVARGGIVLLGHALAIGKNSASRLRDARFDFVIPTPRVNLAFATDEPPRISSPTPRLDIAPSSPRHEFTTQ